MISSAVYTLLTSYTDITDLCSTRIYPDFLPEGVTFEAIRYRMTSETGVSAHDGPIGLYKHNVQFDCYASTGLEAEALARAVRQNIEGYRGTVAGYRIDGIFFINALSDFDNDLNARRRILDFMIHYRDV